MDHSGFGKSCGDSIYIEDSDDEEDDNDDSSGDIPDAPDAPSFGPYRALSHCVLKLMHPLHQ